VKRKAPPTKTSTPTLRDIARHVRVPRGIVKSGWPAVAILVATMGLVFDAWQVGVARLILAKRSDGSYAADTTLLSIPRQVGKTFVLGAIVFALCMLTPNMLVIWTAHHTATSDETFADLKAFAERPRVKKHIRYVRTANGQQTIGFRNGARIRFGARERGFGRGFKKVGILVLDEAQILSQSAMDNLVPTTSRAVNPLVLLACTPPRPGIDPGEVVTALRAEALEAADGKSTTLYVEFSADKDADVRDRAQYRKANPSYPKHTSFRTMQRLLKLLGAASFRREVLGIWDDTQTGELLVDVKTFAALQAPTPKETDVAFGVKFSPDNARVAVAVATLTDDDGIFVEIVDLGSTLMGVGRAATWLASRKDTCDGFAIDGQSHAGLLAEELVKAGVPERRISRPTPDEAVTSYARFLELINAGTLRHSGQPGFVRDVTGVGKRPIGRNGGWGFKTVTQGANDTTVEAAALAISQLKHRPRSTGTKAATRGRRTTGRRKASVM